MKLSLNWLRQFVDLPILDQPFLHEVVVGYVKECEKHPNADKLQVAQVDVGGEIQEIVCGAQNLKQGQKVAVALPGTALSPDFKIAQREIRGVVSNGMICSEDELGLKADRQEGILVLDDKWEPGTPMTTVLNQQGFSPKHIAQLLSLHTAEIEGFEPIANNDYQLDVDNKSITHRPDLWGHYGFAHELSTIFATELKPYETNVEFPKKGTEVQIEVKDKEICNRFTTCIITGIQVSESPAWLKSKLSAIDVTPVNNIVDIANYVMYEIGQPLHTYDRAQVGNDTLQVCYAKAGDHGQTLDHKERTLTSADPIISNGKEFLGLAGIMGSEGSEITDATTEIIIEAANFNATILRRSATHHGLRSDASQRFEKSLDPHMTSIAIEKAAELILQICPDAKLAGPMTDLWINQPEPIKIALNYGKVASYLGIKVEPERIVKILSSLGFIIESDDEQGLIVEVPTWRATKDVQIEADIIEEIGRIIGYNNIPAILPELPTIVPETNSERVHEHNLRQILASLGADEIYNYSFYSKTDFQKALLAEADHFQLKNYLAETQSHLRASLLPNFLHSIHTNLKSKDHFTIFELGRTYKNVGEYFPAEEKKLIIGIVGRTTRFFELKGIVEQLLHKYLTNWTIVASPAPPQQAHPQQVASIMVEQNSIGHIYNLHPLIQQNFELAKTNVAIAEINLGPLLHQAELEFHFQPLPKFPSIEFDVSVAISEEVTAAQLAEAIKAANPELITQINLFDIYRGKNIDEDQKSLAYRITLQHADRTLTDEEMTTVQQAVFKNLEALGGTIRGK